MEKKTKPSISWITLSENENKQNLLYQSAKRINVFLDRRLSTRTLKSTNLFSPKMINYYIIL
jgi:hypothetical protein